MSIEVSFVVVSCGQPELLVECLASIERCCTDTEVATEVAVVLNGHGPSTRDELARRFPAFQIRQLAENRGFAGGVNAGVDAVQGEWIALVNDDATVAENYVDQLLAVTRDDSVGAVAAQMRFAARPDLVNSAGIAVDRLGVAVDRLLGTPVATAPTEPHEVFGACGGAALLRKAMLDDVGGLDDRFFAYLEDVDLAWRARSRGWRCIHAPAAVVWHHHSASASHGSEFKFYLSGRNRVRLLAKNATGSQLLRHLGPIVAYDLFYVIFVGVRHRTISPVRGRLAGLRDWRKFRRPRSAPSLPETDLSPPAGARGALRRRRAWLVGGSQPKSLSPKVPAE